MAVTIALRRDTAADWTSADPILAEGEVGLELDTGKFKVGDGIAVWSSRPYFTGGSLSTGGVPVTGQVSVFSGVSEVSGFPAFTYNDISGGLALSDAGFLAAGDSYLKNFLYLRDSDDSNWLGIDWDENDTAERYLQLRVGGANRILTLSGDATISGTNTGDQTSISGITGTKAQFNTAVTDGDFLYIGDAPSAHTHVWGDITSTPTKIGGYGITDGVIFTGTPSSGQVPVFSAGDTVSTYAAFTYNSISGELGLTDSGFLNAGSAYLANFLYLKDSDYTHTLGIEWDENDTVARYLHLRVSGADRTVTFSGNAILSGTNSGDQTITLTGDVTGTGTSSFATSIANSAVTYGKIQDVVQNRLLGRYTAGAGVVEEVRPLNNITIKSGGTLDVTLSAPDRILGRVTAGSGNSEEITCTAAGRAILDDVDATAQRATLGLGALSVLNTVGTTEIDAAAVTYAKIQNVAADSLIGRSTAGAGVPEEVTCTAFARSILDDADAATARTTLGLGSLATENGLTIGSTSIASGTTKYVLYNNAGVLANTAYAQVETTGFRVGSGLTLSAVRSFEVVDSGGDFQIRFGSNGGATTNYDLGRNNSTGIARLTGNQTGFTGIEFYVEKIGFYSTAGIAQPSSTGETTGFTAGSGTGVNDDSTFTGNVGATAYRISDVVKHLKNLGLLAQ